MIPHRQYRIYDVVHYQATFGGIVKTLTKVSLREGDDSFETIIGVDYQKFFTPNVCNDIRNGKLIMYIKYTKTVGRKDIYSINVQDVMEHEHDDVHSQDLRAQDDLSQFFQEEDEEIFPSEQPRQSTKHNAVHNRIIQNLRHVVDTEEPILIEDTPRRVVKRLNMDDVDSHGVKKKKKIASLPEKQNPGNKVRLHVRVFAFPHHWL